ncbi:hypothetical protein INR49_000679, partial [Caranx melampygus]
MSHPPRSNRGHRGERNGDNHRHYRDSRDDRRSSPDRSSSQPPYYPREADSPPPPRRVRERDVPRVEHHDSKCTNVCSRRGIILMCAVLTNALVLICVVAAHMVSTGLSSRAGLGGFNINSQFNLQGTELQEARDLDMHYSQLRAPGVYGGVAFSLTFGVVSLLFVVAGTKPPHLTSRKLLVGALVFQLVGAVGYVVAVGLYLHFIIRVNSTDICIRRERLYARNGYTWLNCEVSGGDAAVALFGLITAILYTAGTVLTFQTIRRVKRYLQEHKRREAERQPRSQPPRAPLRAETTSATEPLARALRPRVPDRASPLRQGDEGGTGEGDWEERGGGVVTEQTVDVGLHLHAAAVGEDAGDGLLVLAVQPVVGQSSGELPLEAPTSARRPPHADSSRQVEVRRHGLGLRRRLLRRCLMVCAGVCSRAGAGGRGRRFTEAAAVLGDAELHHDGAEAVGAAIALSQSHQLLRSSQCVRHVADRL